MQIPLGDIALKQIPRAKQYVLAYDIHYPEQHEASVEAVFDYLARNQVDGFVFGGDALDCAEVSHHNANKPLYRQRGSFKRNLDGFDTEILSRIEALLPAHAEKVFLIGNHEVWCSEIFETMPELEGMLSIEKYLRLKERGWKVIPQGGFHKLGNLYVIHGDTVGGGVNPSKKAAEVWAGSSVVLGHHHTLSQFTRTSPAHESKRWTATVLPCLSTTNPTYGRNKANTHMHGFGLLSVRPNDDFNLLPVVIVDGVFSIGAEIYSGKTKQNRKYTKGAA